MRNYWSCRPANRVDYGGYYAGKSLDQKLLWMGTKVRRKLPANSRSETAKSGLGASPRAKGTEGRSSGFSSPTAQVRTRREGAVSG